MINFNLDLSFDDPEYPGLRILAEFFELEKYLEKLAEAVPYVQDQEQIRLKAAIARDARHLAMADVEEKVEELAWIAHDLVPRFFIGAFVIALAAAYEGATTGIADYLRHKTNSRLKIGDLREATTHKRIALYFETVIGSGYVLEEDLAERLEELNAVRNCFAHSNGRISAQNDARRKTLQMLVEANCGVSIRENSLVVDSTFAHAYLKHAANAVNSLLGAVHEKYAPSKAPGKG